MQMQVFGMSDVGLKRQLNEDNFEIWQDDRMLIAVVCDGMGGAQAGEVASRMACISILQTLKDELEQIVGKIEDKVELMLAVDRAIDLACSKANKAVYDYSLTDKALTGMGTTAVGIVATEGVLWVFNIGDSRAYHIADGEISQLTVDHSLVQALLDAGKITPEEAVNHPNRNIILRAVGIESGVECDISHRDMQDGCYLLCSDGLSNYFDEKKFLRIISSDSTVSEKAEALIGLANEGGGADNITAVLIDTENKLEAER